MNEKTDIELPQALIDRLTEQDSAVAMLTPDIDRAIVAAAQAQFAARTDVPAPQRAAEWVPAWSLAAAAAAAFVFVVVAVRDPSLPGDYDGSGNVNVLDAFTLSRELSENPQFAANDTVATLMQRIVALDGARP
jgi:hypothetical protein